MPMEMILFAILISNLNFLKFVKILITPIMENLFVILGMLGAWEIIGIIAILLVLFGGRKIPELFKGLGQGIKEFKKASSDNSEKEDQKEQK